MSEEKQMKYPKLQSALRIVMLVCAGVLAVFSAWVEDCRHKGSVMIVSGGILSVCCLAYALLNKDELLRKNK